MRVLLLSTGGTIASSQSGSGLEPELDGKHLLEHLGVLSPDIRFESKDVLNLDSSNIQPEHWQVIARETYTALDDYEGVIITHGTDTMAYTASALSFMLRNLDKSVVLTGSQLPIWDPLTDARTNLYTAIAAITGGIGGVTIAFNRKLIRGTRAVKVSTMGFDAFESVNDACLAQVFADGMRILGSSLPDFDPGSRCVLEPELCADVFLLKLLPGTKPEIFDVLAGMGYRGIIVEAFGAGGVHYINRDILNKLKAVTDMGIAVVVCSQCLYERSDLTIYEVGRRMLDCGVISGRDMTTEAAATKLMWALGKTDSLERIAEMFATSYAGEVTL